MLSELVTPACLDVQVSVTQQAFEMLADIAVLPSPNIPSFRSPSETIFAASLHYLGECNGQVRLECSPSIAFAFTRRVITGSESSGLDSDVRDAIGELVNTIGGNLKGLLPSGVRLSTPKVILDTAADQAGEGCLSCLTFHSSFGAFRLLVLDRA